MINMIKDYIPEKLWKQIEERMPIPCVQAIIFDNMKQTFLLVKRTNEPAKGRYWFVGGRIKRGQNILDALKEQVEGELGIPYDEFFVQFLNVTSSIFETRHTIEINFVASPLKELPEIKLNSESSDYKWVKWYNMPPELDNYLGFGKVSGFHFPHF